MNLEFPEHCLLCLTAIVKQELSNENIKVQSANGFLNLTDDSNCHSSVWNFEQLCEYLKVEFPLNSLKFKNVWRILGTNHQSKNCCESLLCSKCLEMVNGLSVIYGDLRRVQRRIDCEIRSIQEVIKRSDQKKEGDGRSSPEKEGSEHDEMERKRRKVDMRGVGGAAGAVSSSVVADYLEFVETFRTLVKEVNTEVPEAVVLSEEAESLSKIYHQLEEDEEEEKSTLHVKEETGSGVSPSAIPKNEDLEGSMSGRESPVYFFIDEDENAMKEEEEETYRVDDGASSNNYEDDSMEDNYEDSFDGCVEVEVVIEENDSGDMPSPGSESSNNPLSVATMRKKHRPIITCRYCTKTYEDPLVYYKHRKHQHPTESTNLVIPSFDDSTNVTPTTRGMCPCCCWVSSSKHKNILLEFMEHMLSHELISCPVTTVPKDIVSRPDEEKRYACSYCDQRFLLSMNLDLHKICYHESTLVQLKCQECGDDSSKSWEDLVNHLVEYHESETIYSCKSCPMASISVDKLLEHMEIHKMSKRLPCPECSSVSPSMKELYQHFNETHPDVLAPLECQVCQEKFLMPSTYKSHVSKAHIPKIRITTPPSTSEPSQQNVQCPHCPGVRIFKNNITLDNHIRIHHDLSVEKHKCDQCGKAFVHKSTLRYHIQQVHLGIRYNCSKCPKSFTAKSLLKAHLKLHNGEGPPILVCPVCKKVVTSLSALKTHIATQHEDNQPVPCDICGREFLNLYSLRGHKSDVHNLKQFPCPHCPLSFAWLRKYEQHLRTAHPDKVNEAEAQNEDNFLPPQIIAVESLN